MIRPKPVLFFADRLAPLIGGMEIHARYFIEHFKNNSRFPLLGTVTKDKRGKDILLTKTSPINLSKFFDTSHPSVIFFNSGRWIEDLKDIRKAFPESSIIYRTGGNEILKAPLKAQDFLSHHERKKIWASNLNHYVDYLITNSSYTENRLRDIGVNCRFKRFVGGVNTEALQITKSSPNHTITLFSAARFVPYKNHDKLILLTKCLITKGYPISLRLAGDGPLLYTMKKLVYDLNLEKYIKFLGAIDHTLVGQEIVLANLYIQLSSDTIVQVPGGSYIHAEGMGRSILEAISAGTYVIAGNSGALDEIVTKNRGVLVDSNDFEGMVKTIERVLNNLPSKNRLIKDFSWDTLFSKYEEWLSGL